MNFSKNLRILVVDDIDRTRGMIKEMLKQIGFENVDEAESGKKAWSMIEGTKEENEFYQLILSDWSMPLMDGLELLKKIRGSSEFKDTPFLMITAESEQRKVLQVLREGVANFIIKPFSSETLRSKIRKVLIKRK